MKMHDFTIFNDTKLKFGTDYIDEELSEDLAQYGHKVLLTYGSGSIKASGLYARVMDLLKNFEVYELNGIAPNPKIDSVRAGQKLVQEHDIDVILAVGGGSVIDASKVIASAKFYQGDPWDLVLNPSLRQDIKQMPYLDILTLSATGTEMNKGSVISNPETHQKLGTFGPQTPRVSYLDPTLTYSVSKWQTAAGSIDIFSHLTEQYFDRASTDVFDGMIEGVMRTVIANAPLALANPDNYIARGNLMISATMALNSLVGSGNENGWTVHPVEHELSAYYDITHGVGLGILTPRWMEYILDDSSLSKFVQFAKNVWHLNGDDDWKLAHAAIQATYDWVKSLEVPTTLPGVGIEDEINFQAMAKSAVKVGRLANGYKPMQAQDVVALYQASMTNDHFED